MSGGLAPSKSTVYVSNFPFSLTNSDLYKVFEKFGKVGKVTIVKDAERRSKGVAFVLFVNRGDAFKAVSGVNGAEIFGRSWKCSIAKDNGRASEFIQKKRYPDKSKCYECGEQGHLSFGCPKNKLGHREQPQKKEKNNKRKAGVSGEYGSTDNEKEDEEQEEENIDSLSQAIRYQQQKFEEEQLLQGGHNTDQSSSASLNRKKIKKNEYFSDEEEEDDGC